MSTPRKRRTLISVQLTSPHKRRRRLSPDSSDAKDDIPTTNGSKYSLRSTPTTSPIKRRIEAGAEVSSTPTKASTIAFEDGLTPAKRSVKAMSDKTAEKEPERMITRGAQRMRLAHIEDEGQELSEEEEEDDDEDEDEDSGEEGDEDDEVKKLTTIGSYETFFHISARKKKSLTSNNTLSLLPTLMPQESTELLDSIPDHHSTEIQNLHDAHRHQFPQWRFEIENGYNILLFGYGSKRPIIEAFGREELAEDMSVLVINGYFPNLSLDSILTQILAEVAPDVQKSGDKLQLVQAHLSEPLALLIHSLDSPVLRLPKNQQILSALASNKYITIVASVDHVNAPLLFDSLKASRYNFLWHDCTTFVPLRSELSYEETTFLGGGTNATSSVGGLAGIKNVLNNLTSNARALYKLLLEHQLPLQPENNEPAGSDQGITFPQLKGICAKKILPLSNPTTLRGLLGEFYDHGLIVRNDGRGTVSGQAKKGKGTGEVLWAPFGKSIVENVIEFLTS